jgi:type I restriction enzyme R subunit
MDMTEDRLVQRTTAEYFNGKLKWDSVYAFNEEVLGETGTLGRLSEKEVVLTRYLRNSLEKLNPGLPSAAYDSAIKIISESSVSKSMLQINREKYHLYSGGVQVSFRNANGRVEKPRLRIFDFSKPDNNHFMIVRELWIKGALYRRRPDIIGFVNGIPLVFIELKNIHKDIRRAYDENLSDYKNDPLVAEMFGQAGVLVTRLER